MDINDKNTNVSKESEGVKKIQNNASINSKEKKKKRGPKSKISVIILLAVVTFIIAAIISLFANLVNKKIPTANDRMDSYGFSKLYNNGTSNEEETVTKSEAIKMVIAAVLNKDASSDMTEMIEPSLFLENYTGIEKDISGLLEYKNQVWVEYAKAMNIVAQNTITKETESQNATYIEVLEYFANAKKNILVKALTPASSKQYNIKNLDTLYNATEQLAIKDMIENGIIENVDVDFKQDITKKELNSIVINFVEEYNTITVNGEKININPSKIPSNSSEYPYTLASVDKKVYEYGNYHFANGEYKNAISYYADVKKYYARINDVVTLYLNTMLNVDYENFDEGMFRTNLIDATQGNISLGRINNYISYVKENHIKITGSAKVQFPAIYFDGNQTRVRVKLEYTVNNADTLDNLLFGDNNVAGYNKGKFEGVFDIPVNINIDFDRVFVGTFSLNDATVEKVVETVYTENEVYINPSDNVDNSNSGMYDGSITIIPNE